MKPFILALIILSTSVFADDINVDQQIADFVKLRDNAIEALNKSAPNKGKLPDPVYVSEYKKIWDSYTDSEIAVRKGGCTRTSNCLSAEKEAQIRAQGRIVTGLMSAKNNWATDGKSEAEIKTNEEAFKNCAYDKKDCEKVPEVDRKVAEEGKDVPGVVRPGTSSGGTTTTTTTVVVAPKDDGKAPDEETKRKLAESKKTAEDAMKKEIEDELKAHNDKYPGWDKENPMTEATKNFLATLSDEQADKKIAMMKKLCDQYPGTDACLTDAQVADIRDLAASKKCNIERTYQSKNTEITANHDKEWSDLPAPRNCQTLLDKDKGKPSDEPKKETPVTVDDSDDEKTPRNYKAETCKWVTDLPRKIVNGPGCGGKSRSRMCTGYVVCEQKQGGGKFVRMSTCGSDKCGPSDEDAVKCTKDMHYYSQKPSGETKLFTSPNIKKILSGASEQ